jgi:hypothetical protein
MQAKIQNLWRYAPGSRVSVVGKPRSARSPSNISGFTAMAIAIRKVPTDWRGLEVSQTPKHCCRSLASS